MITKRVLRQPKFWNDIKVNFSNVRLPASNAPTERLYNHGIGGGVTFPVIGFAVGNTVYFDIETGHEMELDSVLQNHIHYILPNTTNIGDKFKFQLDVIYAVPHGQYAVPEGSPFTSEHTIEAGENVTHELMGIANIPAVNSNISTIYSCKLTRIGATSNEYGSEVYVKFNDSHFRGNSDGSRIPTAK